MLPDFDHDVACAFQGCLQPDGFIVFTVAILAQGTSWAVAATQAFSFICYVRCASAESCLHNYIAIAARCALEALARNHDCNDYIAINHDCQQCLQVMDAIVIIVGRSSQADYLKRNTAMDASIGGS